MSAPWLRFEVGGLAYAIPLDAVTEVTRACQRRLIPGVPLTLGGVVNVRGEPLPVVDAAVLLGGESLPEAAGPQHALLLERGSLRLALQVRKVWRIEHELPRTVAQSESGDAGPAFVHWVGGAADALGLVDPNGLLEHATALLTRTRVHHEGEESCPSAF